MVYRSKSYFIYATSTNGFKLNIPSMARSQAVVSYFLQNNNYGVNQICRDSIIFAKNAKEWAATFQRNVIGDRNKKQPALHKQFNNMYLLPVGYNSLYLIDDMFYYEYDDDYIEDITRKVIEADSDMKEINDPLYYKGYKAQLCIDMNLTKLQPFYIEAAAEVNKGTIFVLICNGWQVEYYKRVMLPNVKYYITDYIS